MKINLQLFGGRGASSSLSRTIKITETSDKDWVKVRNDDNEIIGYRLTDNVELRKTLDNRFDTTSYTTALYVNGNNVLSNAVSGYTISYLKKLGGYYQNVIDSGIKDPYIYYNSVQNTLYIEDKKTGKEQTIKLK